MIFFKDDPGRPCYCSYSTSKVRRYKIRLDAVVEVSSPLIILSFTEDPSRGAARPSCLNHPREKEKSSVGRMTPSALSARWGTGNARGGTSRPARGAHRDAVVFVLT